MSVFETLRGQVDLVELADRYTSLRPSGSVRVGRCPRPGHDDKNPSFHIYDDARFVCYGCGWRGDSTNFWAGVMGIEPGIAAALDLAQEFGVELPSVNPEEQGQAEERRRLEAEHLETVIPLLQAGEHRFWDPGYSDWCAQNLIDHPLDLEKACKPAYLHAERWRNEHTGEEIWGLVALQEGWRVSDEAIEEAVWRRATADPDASHEKETKEISYEEFEL